MLDIRLIRDDPEFVKARLAIRSGSYAPVVDELTAIDARRRELIARSDAMKAKQNTDSKQIPQIKKAGGDASALLAEMKTLADGIREVENALRDCEQRQQDLLMTLPNLPAPEVPAGRDDSENREQRRCGEPREFDFEARPHWELGESLGILDPAGAGKVTGARFHFYRGLGAALERACISFFLDKHIAGNGYFELLPPYMVNRASMTGTGQLPKFEEDAFKVQGTDYFLVPTAEVPVTNYHRDDIIDGENLPIKYCAYSACFRAEAGSAGRDTRGLIRQHQFNKVELVKFTTPESSMDELEKLTRDAESVLQALGLPYRVVLLCSGDLGFSSAKTYDIEVWMPSYGRYVEISSCSDFLDFQARRANIRYRPGKGEKPRLVHTLNGSGVAVGRAVAAIIENFQNADGTITIPEALRPYMHGREKITK